MAVLLAQHVGQAAGKLDRLACAQMLLAVVAASLDRSLKLAVEHQQVAILEWLLNNGTYEDGLLQGIYNRPHDRDISRPQSTPMPEELSLPPQTFDAQKLITFFWGFC